jgi:hypothetical protein
MVFDTGKALVDVPYHFYPSWAIGFVWGKIYLVLEKPWGKFWQPLACVTIASFLLKLPS